MKIHATITAACSLLVLALAISPCAAQRFVDWGDQGDGTYCNPVLNGDFADSDIERDCNVAKGTDRWVMITSTNHYAPGMSILESKDLVNWRYLSHAFTRLDWEPRYNADQMAGYKWGVWAGDLVQRDGEWLCYQIDFKSGLYMTKAKELTGPWSKPVCLLKKSDWTDPAVFFDEQKHEAWLVANFGKIDEQKTHDIRLFKLNWQGDQLLDEGRTIFQGTECEAAKLRRFDGRWHVMLIQWMGEGTSRDRKQLCLRSTTDSPYGPYESKVVFERLTDDDRSCCQGSLIKTDDGRWWFYHQLVQNGEPVFHGRPQCLEPVNWIDGWPIIGKDIDGDGIGEPVWQHEKPQPIVSNASTVTQNASNQHSAVQSTLQTSDEFDTDQLGPQWNWNHNPRDDRWSLTARPGFLRLTACRPINNAQGKVGGFWEAANTLSQRQLGIGKTRTETRLDFSGMKPGMRGGLCHHSGRFALFGVVMDPEGEKRLTFNNSGRAQSGPIIEAETIYLRSDTDGDQATFSWSLDGEKWTETDWRYTLVFGNWRGNRPGLFCWNLLTDDAEAAGHLDVDWFRYDY